MRPDASGPGDCDANPNAPSAESSQKDIDRRSFVAYLAKIGAGALAVTVGGAAAVGLTRRAVASTFSQATASEPSALGSKFHYGMVIDTRRCVGCRACVIGCKAENKTPPGVYYTVVVDHVIEPRVEDKPLYMTKPCFHCEQPPCVDVCPVSATYKRAQDGIVVVDYDRCIGCRYCMTTCPYSARWFDFGENYSAVADKTPYADVPSPEYRQFRKREKETSPIGNVRKCTFCLHLQDKDGRYDKAAGRWPACAKTCTGHAIHFGDLNDTQSEISILLRERVAVRLKEELGTAPSVFYLL